VTKKIKIVPDAPKAIVTAFRAGSTLPLAEYLQLDDHSVSEFMKACRNSSDSKLKELATGILDRNLYKAVDASGASGASISDFAQQVVNLLGKKNLDLNDNFESDSASDTPYKPYDPDSDKPNDQIYIENSFGVQQEFGTLSEPVQQLKKEYSLLRYYFPSDLRSDIAKIASDTITKNKKKKG
jgi:HD superfamily phosphohydrolase